MVRSLLEWFAANSRDLPWRRTRDPYSIWVSEIMLQQTQVKTVIPYWKRWIRQLPTIRSLARMQPEKVLKLWEGLGYYSRVRNLQRAAQLIVQKHAGQFPTTFEDVLALPGIGRYSAGAICSIAFNQPRPALDGNVIRVLTRVFGISANPREKKTNDNLWQLATTLVQEAARNQKRGAWDCSNLNQALMELGATLCTPRQPECPLCPVRKFCTACRQNRTAELPALRRRPRPIQRRCVAFVVESNGRYLVRQRTSDSINASLWEFPNAEIVGTQREFPHIAKAVLGFRVGSLRSYGEIKHSITRSRITLQIFRTRPALRLERGVVKGVWRSLTGMENLPFASAHRQVLNRLLSDSNKAKARVL